jgi:hypothetical protein
MGPNNLIGPKFGNIDFSAIKDTRISERFRLQFRAEFFNVLNHANWGQPNALVFSQDYTPQGQPIDTINPTAGQITTLAEPMRQIQFGLKLMF